MANKILKDKMLQELQMKEDGSDSSSDDMDELIEDMKREKKLVLIEHGVEHGLLGLSEMPASGIDDDVEESLWWQRFIKNMACAAAAHHIDATCARACWLENEKWCTTMHAGFKRLKIFRSGMGTCTCTARMSTALLAGG